MKKFLAKLALFTITSIVLAMPLQAWAKGTDQTKWCITDDEKKNFIITLVEEPFGDAETYNKGKTAEELKVFKAKDCCRRTIYLDGKNPKSEELDSGSCPAGCKIVTTYNKEGDSSSGIKSKLGQECQQVMAIFSQGGTTMIEGYISIIYTWAASIVGLIAVTVIIISGIQIAISGGDSTALDAGKNRIIKSLSGLAVLFLSGLILYTINPNFFTR